jgi:DNA-binding transcriptional MocR family regulator
MGRLKPGSKLPSVRDICQKFHCSKVTAVKAYDLLQREHIIYSVPKSGHYLIGDHRNINPENSGDPIDFSTSALDDQLLPYEEFQHCLNEATEVYKTKLFSFSNAQGLENLIAVIAKQLGDYQVFTKERCIYITSGSQQAINILSMMPFPNERENVLVEQPTYYGALESLKLNKVKTFVIQRKRQGIDFDELEQIFRENRIKFFYTIPRFHNPTGFSYSMSEKRQILKLAEKYDVYIVEDDYLADLEVNKKADPIFSLDLQSQVIYLKSYSKTIVPGLRIAAVVLPELLTGIFEKYKRWNDLNTSVLSQGILETYIKSGMFKAHTRKLQNIYAERMSYLKELTRGLNNPSIIWNIPNSGFFANIQINNNGRIKDVLSRLRMKQVIMEDTQKFFLTGPAEEPLLRLSISKVNHDQIKQGIATILNELNN